MLCRNMYLQKNLDYSTVVLNSEDHSPEEVSGRQRNPESWLSENLFWQKAETEDLR